MEVTEKDRSGPRGGAVKLAVKPSAAENQFEKQF
jgi:hypothetical protein